MATENDCELEFESLSLFLEKNRLQKYQEVFTRNCIMTVEDVKRLSDEDLRELEIPVGARNRIKAYFLQ